MIEVLIVCSNVGVCYVTAIAVIPEEHRAQHFDSVRAIAGAPLAVVRAATARLRHLWLQGLWTLAQVGRKRQYVGRRRVS